MKIPEGIAGPLFHSFAIHDISNEVGVKSSFCPQLMMYALPLILLVGLGATAVRAIRA